MSNISSKPATPEDPWDAVTWEGAERAQLRRMRMLSLREKVLAIEGMNEVGRLMAQARERGQREPERS
jgi:hypothetical protein